jgi:hypothetical protein
MSATPSDPPSTPPSGESDYRMRDLGYKKKTLVLGWISFSVSVCGFAAVVSALFYNAMSFRSNVQQSMVRLVTDLDKVFIDRPDLVNYFEGGEDIDPTNPKFAQAYATAVMFLDVMDLAETQNGSLQSAWSTPDAWDEWITDEFAESPILRKVYLARANWYGGDLRKSYEKGMQKAGQNPDRSFWKSFSEIVASPEHK